MLRFERLPGLPATGPWPEQFSVTGLGTHSEGLVVKFFPSGGAPWIGNFQGGIANYTGVHEHPNQVHLIVVASGQAYIVDPESRLLRGKIGAAIVNVYEIVHPRLLVFDHQGIAFEALDPTGNRWHTRRLSWDGFRSIAVVGGEIRGEAWDPIDSEWRAFVVDLSTGRSSGGSYDSQDSRKWEKLNPHAG
jgi:hypothetical protein